MTLTQTSIARTLTVSALLCLALGAPPEIASGQGRATRITVDVRDLRSDRGHVRIALYDGPSRWTHTDGAVASCAATVQDGHATCVIRAPRAGRYAIALLADENDDGEMGLDLLGLPTEGYGFSNDVRPTLSAPGFDSASFEARGPARLSIAIRYGI